MAAWMTINVTQNHLWLPVPFTVKQLGKSRLLMRNSNGEGGSTTVSPVEGPKGPPSLISAVNVEKALRGIAITDVDHYGRLGVERGCSSDEVRIAYEKKVLEMMNELAASGDKELVDEQQRGRLELLKESYGILCTDEERRLYDWSLGRKEDPERYIWPFEVDKSPLVSSDNPPPAQPPENHRPTTLLAYFLATWFFLSIMLFILFNT